MVLKEYKSNTNEDSVYSDTDLVIKNSDELCRKRPSRQYVRYLNEFPGVSFSENVLERVSLNHIC